MNAGKKKSVFGEVVLILVVSVFLAFSYNTFSSKGLPLLRTSPIKVAVDDSLLFPHKSFSTDSVEKDSEQLPQTAKPVPRQLETSSSHKTSKVKDKKQVYNVVTLDQVNRLLKEGRGMFIDARDNVAYRKGHIKGAINIFGDEPDEHFPELAPLPRDTLVVLYCNGPDCHLGRALAEFMSVMEFTNLLLYDDGWEGWQKAKMPEEQSK